MILELEAIRCKLAQNESGVFETVQPIRTYPQLGHDVKTNHEQVPHVEQAVGHAVR